MHLVGFSLGGLVMRAVAAESPLDFASLLLIGLPNAASSIADLAVRFAPTPARPRLMTSAPALPEIAGIPVGCIAGPMGLLFSEVHDGRIVVS